jgi:hypothetical protein
LGTLIGETLAGDRREYDVPTALDGDVAQVGKDQVRA